MHEYRRVLSGLNWFPFALALIVALPGIYRAIRRFERDGDRVMLLWLACIVIAMRTNKQNKQHLI